MSQVVTSTERKIEKSRDFELGQEAIKKSLKLGGPDCVDGILAHRSQGGQQRGRDPGIEARSLPPGGLAAGSRWIAIAATVATPVAGAATTTTTAIHRCTTTVA